LSDTPSYLPVDDGWVDHRTAVLDHQVPRDLDPSGFEVDLDDAGVRGRRPATVGVTAVGRGDVEWRRGPVVLRDRCPPRDFGEREAAGGHTLHVDIAGHDVDIRRRRLEHLCCLFDDQLPHLP
jgi:hypothetical protein